VVTSRGHLESSPADAEPPLQAPRADSVWAAAREPWPSAYGRLLDSFLTNAWSDGVDEVFGTHRERTGAFNASE